MRRRDPSVLRRRVAANVRRLRLAAGLTQHQAGEQAGIGWRHWQRVEAAEANITISTLVKLANALGVQPAELFRTVPARRRS